MKELGDRNLAVMICSNGQNPVYYFSTYDKKNKTNDVNKIAVIDLDDFDGVWNWIYFAYSASLKKARGFVYFGKTGTQQFLEFDEVEHNKPLPKLKFMLGKQFQWLGFNGFVDGVQFSTQVGCFKLSEKEIASFLTNDVAAALPLLSADLEKGIRIATAMRAEDTYKATDEKFKTRIWEKDFAFADEYAVWGWV